MVKERIGKNFAPPSSGNVKYKITLGCLSVFSFLVTVVLIFVIWVSYTPWEEVEAYVYMTKPIPSPNNRFSAVIAYDEPRYPWSEGYISFLRIDDNQFYHTYFFFLSSEDSFVTAKGLYKFLSWEGERTLRIERDRTSGLYYQFPSEVPLFITIPDYIVDSKEVPF